MFSLHYSTKYEGPVKTINFKDRENSPIWKGPGMWTDVDGNEWDVHGVFCNEDGNFVWAAPLQEHEKWFSTDTNVDRSGTRQWIPYKVKFLN